MILLYSRLSSAKLRVLEVKCMQRSGTEAIRTQLQPSKPKREITKITNSQNTNRTYGQPNRQLFPKRWPLSNGNRTKNTIDTFLACHLYKEDTTGSIDSSLKNSWRKQSKSRFIFGKKEFCINVNSTVARRCYV